MTTRNMECNKPHTCEFCHAYFETVRYDAKFCSTKCRVAYHRFMRLIGKYEAQLDDLANKLNACKHTDLEPGAENLARKMANHFRRIADWLEE